MNPAPPDYAPTTPAVTFDSHGRRLLKNFFDDDERLVESTIGTHAFTGAVWYPFKVIIASKPKPE